MECTSDETEHELYEHTFNTVQRCHKCNKYLFGIIRQGLQCKGINSFIYHAAWMFNKLFDFIGPTFTSQLPVDYH